jgi:hypothetical protein
VSVSWVRPALTRLAGVALLAVVASPLLAQDKTSQKYQDHVLAAQALAGQTVVVVPITFIGADSALKGDSALMLYWNRVAGLRHFDSLFADYLSAALHETKWYFPPDLRKIYTRSNGYFPDPDYMGQSALRNPGIKKKVPEPLYSNFRALSGVTDARVIIVPASVVFARDSTQLLTATLSAVVIEPRLGEIRFRTIATGHGVSPDAALRAAFATMIPAELLPE